MIAMMSIHNDLREKFIMLSLFINHYHHVRPEGIFELLLLTDVDNMREFYTRRTSASDFFQFNLISHQQNIQLRYKNFTIQLVIIHSSTENDKITTN
jgi:hypothetical protein